MELNGKTLIPFPRLQVFTTYRDHLEEVVPFLPNIESLTIDARVKEGTLLRLVNRWRARIEIAAATRKLLDPEMFAWTDTALWNKADWCCDWKIETGAMPGLMACSGTTTFVAVDKKQTEVLIAGNLQLHLDRAPIPRLLVGTIKPLIEKMIITSLAPNLLSMGEGVSRYLASTTRPT